MADLPAFDSTPPVSPHWGLIPKFLAAFVILVLLGALLARFQEMVGPLVLAIIVAYFLHPPIRWVAKVTRWSWGASVNVVYGTLILLALIVLTMTGIAIEQQVVNLYGEAQALGADLPARIAQFLSKPIDLAPLPYKLDWSTTNVQALTNQIVQAVQPLLSQAGTVAGSVASGTASSLGWGFFMLIVIYYLLQDLHNLDDAIIQRLPPHYQRDIQRLIAELGPLWNAYLRGQVTIALTSGLVTGTALSLLGIPYAPLLGVLAMMGEFVPMVGPTASEIIGVLVAFFLPSNWLGLNQIWFAVVVFGVYFIWQQILANAIGPRIMGQSLKLNPVFILIGAIVGANLAGMIGLILSAPIVATVRLIIGFVYRKVADLDPWPTPEAPPPPKRPAWPPQWLKRLLRQTS